MANTIMKDHIASGDLVGVVLHFNERFDAHVKEEMERYKAIEDLIDQQMNASQVRFDETSSRLDHMMQSIEGFTQSMEERSPCKHLLEAIPNGDFIGHRQAHTQMMTEAQEKADLWKKIKAEIAKWAVIAFTGWVGLLMWHGFLRGPA